MILLKTFLKDSFTCSCSLYFANGFFLLYHDLFFVFFYPTILRKVTFHGMCRPT